MRLSLNFTARFAGAVHGAGHSTRLTRLPMFEHSRIGCARLCQPDGGEYHSRRQGDVRRRKWLYVLPKPHQMPHCPAIPKRTKPRRVASGNLRKRQHGVAWQG